MGEQMGSDTFVRSTVDYNTEPEMMMMGDSGLFLFAQLTLPFPSLSGLGTYYTKECGGSNMGGKDRLFIGLLNF